MFERGLVWMVVVDGSWPGWLPQFGSLYYACLVGLEWMSPGVDVLLSASYSFEH